MSLPNHNNISPPNPLTVAENLHQIKLLCCDVDGVMTDGGLYYTDNGERFWRFHVLDGMGLKMLQAAGVPVAVITQSRSPAIAHRMETLGIVHVYMGVDEKCSVVENLVAELNIDFSQVAHIADDVNDLTLLQAVGMPVCVPNAVAKVKQTALYQTSRSGGAGAVRELCEAICNAIEENTGAGNDKNC